jgi:hypothetical protein
MKFVWHNFYDLPIKIQEEVVLRANQLMAPLMVIFEIYLCREKNVATSAHHRLKGILLIFRLHKKFPKLSDTCGFLDFYMWPATEIKAKAGVKPTGENCYLSTIFGMFSNTNARVRSWRLTKREGHTISITKHLTSVWSMARFCFSTHCPRIHQLDNALCCWENVVVVVILDAVTQHWAAAESARPKCCRFINFYSPESAR